jgi:peptide/nickel transport system substrate-binding protein
MGFTIAPLHYYGDESLYDYDKQFLRLPKGDLSGVKAKNTEPWAAAPTSMTATQRRRHLKANPYYFKGEPEIGVVLMQEGVDSDYVPGIITGTFDVAVPSISEDTLLAIKDGNSNGEIVGDNHHHRAGGLPRLRLPGHHNADLVNVDNDPASDASKALRKGFMTLFSVYRDTVINSYYGDRAAVIQYPISNTSWAAPKPADEGYHTAYSVDVDGNAIYDSSMSEEQRYEAAREAAIGYFKPPASPMTRLPASSPTSPRPTRS